MQACLVPKDTAQAPVTLSLEPRARTPVPLACHHGWLWMGDSTVWTDPQVTNAGTEARRLEISPAALEVLAGRRVVRLAAPDEPNGLIARCYHASVTATVRPHQGWAITLHEPLVLHNSLLCNLDYELIECGPTSAKDGSNVHRGRLPAGTSFPFLGASVTCQLRTSCPGYHWSQPVHIDLALSDRAEAPTQWHALLHPSLPGQMRGELHLRLAVAGGSPGVRAEVSGHVWVVNESHVPLRLDVAGGKRSTVVVPPSYSPGDGLPHSEPLREQVGAVTGAIALPVGNGEALPEILVHEEGAPRRRGAGAFISLPDLLRHRSDNLLLDAWDRETPAENGTVRLAPHLLDLGVKLLPLPHSLGNSLLLAISPRLVVLNRTDRPLLLAQRGPHRHIKGHTELPCDGSAWVPIHWYNLHQPREALLRRCDDGAEWSGAITNKQGDVNHVGGADLTLRLRNGLTGSYEFVQLVWHRLTSRATAALTIANASSPPIIIHNETQHELRCKQANVPITLVPESSVLPGEVLKYAWDEPAGKLQLRIHVPALAVRLQCEAVPCRFTRPRFASLLGREPIELEVRIQATTTIVVVRSGAALAPIGRLLSPLTTALTALGAADRMRRSSMPPPRLDVSRLSVSDPSQNFQSGATWQLTLNLYGVGATLLDNEARELLYLSVRGLGLRAKRALAPSGPVDSLALAVASVQLDCQLPRAEANEEVLLHAGVAVPGDAVILQLHVTGDESVRVLQCAVLKLQEIALRVDAEALGAVAAALQIISPARSTTDEAGSIAPPWHRPQPPSGMLAELKRVREEGLRQTPRLFVRQLRLAAIPLKLSLQRPSRPEVSSPHGAIEGRPEDGATPTAWVLRLLRLLGIGFIMNEVPLRLPEVAVHQAPMPADSLFRQVQQQYKDSLQLQAFYKLPSSAAILGDPYGMLRTVRQGWRKLRQALRRAPPQHVPAVAVQGCVELLQALAANFMRSTGKTALAISSLLETLLSEQGLTQAELTMPEALLSGVGGMARETSKAVQRLLEHIDGWRGTPVPGLLQFLLAIGLLPVGVGQAMTRLALLLAIGSLSWMRSTVDAGRSVLVRPRRETGRWRAARPMDSPALYPFCAAVRGASALRSDGSLVCAEVREPKALLVLTAGVLRCTGPLPDDTATWEVPLTDLLLIQQIGSTVHLLVLPARGSSAAASTTDSVLLPTATAASNAIRKVTTNSVDDATRLHEMLRLAGLNARGVATTTSPSRRWPLLRASLLAPSP